MSEPKNPDRTALPPGKITTDEQFLSPSEVVNEDPAEPDDSDPDDGSVLDCLVRLVAAFDADDGQTDDVYHATVGLLHHHLGDRPVRAFCRHLDGGDDRHVLREGSLPLVLRDIRRAAGQTKSAVGE